MSELPSTSPYINENDLERMTEETIEAMRDRNGWDTHKSIPRKLKSLAYDLWGRDPKQCVMCGSTGNPHLHHAAPEVRKWVKNPKGRNVDEDNWLDPYNDTEPWQLVPLCPSCHRKVENMNFSLLKYAMWWACLRKRGEYRENLYDFLDARIDDMEKHHYAPTLESYD